ncbi:MAG: hypothetical protein ACOCRX_05065 [Candidatus Woesearchaeota archaeon]
MDDLVGKEVMISIEDISSRPWGFLNHGDYRFLVFVREKSLSINQEVKVKIKKRKKRFFIATPINTKKYSSSKLCGHYHDCEGCNLLHLKHPEQLGILKSKLNHFCKKEDVFLDYKSISSKQHHYRNKFRGFLNFRFDANRHLNIKLGLYDENNNITDISNCLVNSKKINQLLNQLKDYLQTRAKRFILNTEYDFEGYEKVFKKDIKFHVSFSSNYDVFNSSYQFKDNYVIFIDFNKNSKNGFYDKLIEKPFYQFFKKDKANIQTVIKSDSTFSLKRNSFICDKIDLESFGIRNNSEINKNQQINYFNKPSNLKKNNSHEKDNKKSIKMAFLPGIFKQCNSSINLKIIKKISEKVDLFNNLNIIDLYCGNGNLSLFNLDKKHVSSYYGFESNKMSCSSLMHSLNINDFNINSKVFHTFINPNSNLNKIKSVFSKKESNLLILNPPRNYQISKIIDTLEPNQFIYLSCSPRSFLKDIKHFDNYKKKEIILYDMFPNTTHFEMFGYFQKEK